MSTQPTLDLRRLIEPRGVAIAAGGWSDRLTENLKAAGYQGQVSPLSAAGKSGIDLAVFTGGDADLSETLDRCADAGIAHLLLLEGEDGKQLQTVPAAVTRGITLYGARSMGVINSEIGLSLTAASPVEASRSLVESHVSVLCQKGRVGVALARLARDGGYAFRSVIGTGEESVVSIADCIDALADDEKTRVIAICLSHISDGCGFSAALAKAQRCGKRVVVLKDVFADAGEELIWRSMLGRLGAILAQSFVELVDIAIFLGTRDRQGLPKGHGVAIVSGGGGNGVNAADLCARYDLPVPVLTDATLGMLKPLVPSIASLGNPFDLTPEMGSAKYAGNYAEVLDLISADERIDTIFFPINAMSRARMAQIGVFSDFRTRDRADLLLAFNMLGSEQTAELAAAKAYNFVEPERGVKAFRRMIEAGRFEAIGMTEAPASPEAVANGPVGGPAEVAAHAEITLLPQTFAATEDESVRLANEIGYPVVLRYGSADQPVSAGDIRNDAELRSAYGRAAKSGAQRALIQKQSGSRLAYRFTGLDHPVFGPIVIAQAGGEFFGLVKEQVVAPATIDRKGAEGLLSGLGVSKNLGKIDRTAKLELVFDAFHRFAQAILTARPQTAITFDPVFVGEEDVVVAATYSMPASR